MDRVPPQLLLLATVASWALSFTTTRYGVTHGFAPMVFATLRWIVAALALGVLVALRRRRLVFQRHDLTAVGLVSILGVGVQQVAFNYSLQLTQASTVALVFGLQPLLVSTIAHLSGVERMQRRNWVAAGLSVTGVLFVGLGQGGASTHASGLLLALVAAAIFAGYSVAVQPYLQRNSAVAVTGASALACACLLTVVGAPALASRNSYAPGVIAWCAVAYTGVVPVAIGNVLWLSGMRRVGPARASLYLNLQPVLGAGYGVVLLSEKLTPPQVCGGILIVTGIFVGADLMNRKPKGGVSARPLGSSAEGAQQSDSGAGSTT